MAPVSTRIIRAISAGLGRGTVEDKEALRFLTELCFDFFVGIKIRDVSAVDRGYRQISR